jgi:hypothetical protein
MSDLLLQAMNAKQSGNTALTKQLVAQALIQDPHNEGAWMLMYELVEDIKLKRNCLERVLAINPGNTSASNALTRLDTSPLGPVLRGERYKPVIPAKPENAPPFTPPFTWTGNESQFQALGDMTFPDLTDEKAGQPPETPTTFDWATESGEPDKTINKIFDAVSNPELASQPLPDSGASWLNNEPTSEQAGEAPMEAKEPEPKTPDELAGPKTETQQKSTMNLGDFSVSAEPEWGMDAFAYTEETPTGPTESEPLLWDNPKAPIDRLVILGNKSIIYANPVASDIPHILGLFNEKKMLRDLLGQNAGVIKLDSIQRLSAISKRSNLDIDYTQNEKVTTHQLVFKNRQERDEVLASVQLRLGADFIRTTRSFSFGDKILSPLLCILLVVALGWLLIAGLPQLAGFTAFQSGTLQLILYNLQYYVNLIGAFNLVAIAVILVVLCLIWLLVNLPKPSSVVIVERPKPKLSRTNSKPGK